MTIRWRYSLAVTYLLVALAAAPVGAAPAAADETAKAEALRALKEGAALLDANRPAEALVQFEDAFRLVPSPKIHFNIGLALRALGDGRAADAYEAFRRFVAEAADAAPDKRVEAREYVDTLERRVALATVSADCPDAQLVADGRSVGRLPLRDPLPLGPGEHTLVIEPPGRAPVRRHVRAVAGTRLEVPMSCGALAASPLVERSATGVTMPAPNEPPPPSLWRRPSTWIVIGGVVLAGAASVYLLTRERTNCFEGIPCVGVR